LAYLSESSVHTNVVEFLPLKMHWGRRETTGTI
jgi:hypothetical protein